MALDLKKLHQKQAERWRREAATKLRQSRGTGGQGLAPKKRPNGRPLGFGISAGGIPARIRRGKIRALLTGYDVTVVGRTIGDVIFDTGSRRQVRRPYAGLSARQLKKNARELLGAITQEGRRLGVWK